jgi:tRNA 2-selenouridine synthase
MSTPLPPGPPLRPGHRVSVDDLSKRVDRIDVRSPSEFAEDHLPGAMNLPVLDDDERALVGTTYVQQSAFEARKAGAAIVARNIARIVETHVRDKPPEWAPLI